MSTPNHAAALQIRPGSIVVPTQGLRRAATTQEQDAGLLGSIRALGILQPIIVRAHPAEAGMYVLVAGRRRLRAAQAAGLDTVPAIDRADLSDADSAAIEAAENMQRAAMAPTDQWRAIREMQSLGWSLDGAAEALGIPHRTAQRLDKLGRLHPDVLAAIEAHGLPDAEELASIAQAPLDVQAAAMRAQAGMAQPCWWNVAEACQDDRTPREWAVFDTATAGVVFEEDLFAEPGTEWQFTTHDKAGFMAAQRAALAQMAADSKGRLRVADLDKHGHPRLPQGWDRLWGWRHADGKPPRGAVGFLWLSQDGRLQSAAAKPQATADTTPAPAPATASAGDAEAESPEEDADHEAPPLPPPPDPPAKPRLTQAGRELLAALRTDGLRAALRDRAPPVPPLALLLLALSARNVTVHGEVGSKFSPTLFGDIAAATFAALDQPQPFGLYDRLERIAREAVARILICDGTKAGNGSGDAAEWIGELVRADATLPRLDRAELLAAMSGDLLREIAVGAGIKDSGKVAGLRQALTGAVPDLRLPEARFGAPRPELEPPPECDRAAGHKQCDCGWVEGDREDTAYCGLGEWQAQMERLGLRPSPAAPEPAPPAEAPSEHFPDTREMVPAPPADAPPPAHTCPWDGASQCPDDLKRSCTHECPRREEYDAWWESPAADRAARSPQELAAAQLAQPPAAPATGCGWNGESLCREEGTTVCHKLCPRHARYAEWVTTPQGKAARRRQENAEARARLREGRRPPA
ncbi:ParB/RepB/Spo0J family partition protein [Falsiroseomonas selenitidurans]|uniref:ParB/RepB/Spo0J family partition protein n=1 Tax=Falsiroseomonas selenitidurans TaxID=2716335 RepID=A0ABX1E8C3_9PROT|nr:ParB/RepB/Spo0J family partition protein [Falsiroseomonas selenitidurans]NKC33470.1 ParB/RepB/Spo0J family partition protein [Falsiroseomonas selenitidurans]